MMKFKYLSLELSSECKLRCEWCARRTMTRKPGHMSLETAQLVADELDPIKSDLYYLVLNCWGEPTMNPQLLEIIRLFSGRIKTVLSTNCLDFVEGLTDSGLQELILHVNHVDGRREKVAKQYIENLGKLDLLFIQLLVTPETEDRAEWFIHHYKPFAGEKVKLFLKYPIIDQVDEYVPIRGDLEKFADSKVKFKQKKVLVGGEPNMPRGLFCSKLREHLTVLDDGTLVLECCRVNHELKIGHISGGLLRSFNGKRATKLRQNFPKEEPCKTCKRKPKSLLRRLFGR